MEPDQSDKVSPQDISRRTAISRLVVGSAVAALIAGDRQSAWAQEATPVVTEGDMGEGITFEQIDFGVVDVLPPAPAAINFFHARLEPGASIAVGAEDPGLGPQLVESGTLTVRNFTADIVIQRADGEEEVVSAGVEVTLGAGDRFVWEPNVGGEMANDGDEPLLFYTVNIFPVSVATPEAATTAATPAV